MQNLSEKPHLKGLYFSLTLGVFIWGIWFTVLGGLGPVKLLIRDNWPYATTMVFGSVIAGGTSLGGGAVAFPVFTKVLGVDPFSAKVFSLAIQSIGMTAASLVIILLKTPVKWGIIGLASIGGLCGLIIGQMPIFNHILPSTIRLVFVALLIAFSITLVFSIRKGQNTKTKISLSPKEKITLIVVGLAGGLFSALLGTGIDILLFSYLVLYLRQCKRVSTLTSVITMAINALLGFFIYHFYHGDFIAPITEYWLASIPVVVIGAPLGAIIAYHLKPKWIVRILLFLIFVEIISSFILTPFNQEGLYVFITVLLITSGTFWRFHTQSRL